MKYVISKHAIVFKTYLLLKNIYIYILLAQYVYWNIFASQLLFFKISVLFQCVV